MTSPLQKARDSGYDDAAILKEYVKTRPEVSEKINKAIESKYTPTEIIDHLLKNPIVTPQATPQQIPQQTQEPDTQLPVRIQDSYNLASEPSEPNLWEAFAEGFADESSMAILMGEGMSAEERMVRARRKLSFTTRVSKTFGDLIGSLPTFVGGAVGGSVAGGAAGTAVPGVGNVAGAAIGAGVGGFALDTAIKTAYHEYLDLIDKDPRFKDASFLEVVQNIDKSPILIEAAKSGLLGGVLALNPLLGQVAKIPGIKPFLTATPGKFLQRAVVDKAGKVINPASELTKIGKAAAFGTEMTTLTTGAAALEGQLPTPEQLVENVFVLGGLKMSMSGARKLIRGAKNQGNFGAFKELDGFTKQEMEAIDKATPSQVAEIIAKHDKRVSKANVPVEHVKAQREVLADGLVYNKPGSKIAPPKKQSFQEAIKKFEKDVEWNDPRTLVERTKDALNKDFNNTKMQTQAFDRAYPLKDLTARVFGVKPSEVEVAKLGINGYMSLRNSEGAVAQAKYELENFQFDWKTKKNIGPGYEKIKAPLSDVEIRELNLYRLAKRTIDQDTRRPIKTGLDLEAAKVIAKEGKAKYEPYNKKLDRFHDNQLKWLVDSGDLSKKDATRMLTYTDYISMERVMNPEIIQPKSKKIIQKRKGVDTEKPTPKIKDPDQSVYDKTYRQHKRAIENEWIGDMIKSSQLTAEGRKIIVKAKRKPQLQKIDRKQLKENYIKDQNSKGEAIDPNFLETIDALSDSALRTFRLNRFTPKEGLLVHMEKGKEVYWEVKDKGLADMIKSYTDVQEFNTFVKALAVPARTLRAGAILDVRFLAKNPIRDYFGALLFSKYDMSPMAPLRMVMYNAMNHYKGPGSKYIHSLQGVKAFDDLYGLYIKSGGGLSTMQGIDAAAYRQRLSKFNRAKQWSPFKVLRKIGEITEEAARLAEFEAALKVEGNTPLGRKIAAFASRDLSIDFAKSGVLSRALNTLVPFFNAQLQGTEKIFREATRNRASRDRLLYNATMKLITPSLIIALLNKGDPDIEQLQDYERDSNWIYRNPVTGRLNKIPVPFEEGIIFNGLTRRWVDLVATKDIRAFDGYLRTVIDGAVPAFMPQAALPVIETLTNYNFFRNTPLIPPRLEGTLLSTDQYTNYTSDTAKTLGRVMMHMARYYDDSFSQNNSAQKAVGNSRWTSPIIIDHFIESWTGGLGKTFRNFTDTLLRKTGIAEDIIRPSQPVLERYGLNPFSIRFPRASVKSIREFYDNYFTMQKALGSAKAQAIRGEGKQAMQTLKAFNVVKMERLFQGMSNMQSAINFIWQNADMTAEEKASKIDKLYRNMIEVTKAVNEEIYQQQRKKK